MPSSLIVQSSLNYFAVDQTAATNSLHLQSVYQHPKFTAPSQSEIHVESIRTSVVEAFAEIVDVFRPLVI